MRTPAVTKSTLAALAVSIATIAAGTWLAIVSVAPATSVTPAELAPNSLLAPVPTPTPIAVQPIPIAMHPSAECPQMNNPGGRLNWVPSKDPGPTPTNGRVILPTLGVNAPLVRVGIDGQDKMVVPGNARDVAWLDRGGIPGYTNNVVLAGHIAFNHINGSFGRIGDLHPGDEVSLQISNKTLRYRVIWTCLFGRNTDRAEQIMGYTNVPSVTLISCGGGWDSGARTHTSRYAIRAEEILPPTPEPAEPGLGADEPAHATATPVGLLGKIRNP